MYWNFEPIQINTPRRGNIQQTNPYRGDNSNTNDPRNKYPQSHTPTIRALHAVLFNFQHRHNQEHIVTGNTHNQSMDGIQDYLQNCAYAYPQINHVTLKPTHHKTPDAHKHDGHFPLKMIISIELLSTLLLILFLLPCGSSGMPPTACHMPGLNMYSSLPIMPTL